MVAHDSAPDHDDDLTAAAQAATSWVRARRSNWTSAPLAFPSAPARLAPPAAPVAVTQPVPAVPLARPPAVQQPSQPSLATRAVEWMRPLAAPAGRWLIRGGAASLAIVALVSGGRYLLNVMSSSSEKSEKTGRTVAAPAQVNPTAPAARRKPTGELRVNSTPSSQVIVDGRARGVTPLSLADLSPGRHEITLKSDAGTVRRARNRRWRNRGDRGGDLLGWVTLYSPFEVAISVMTVLRGRTQSAMLLPGATSCD